MKYTLENPPTCPYCHELLGLNEYDDEPGCEPGFYSAHFDCQQAHADGRYVIQSYLHGDPFRWTNGQLPIYGYRSIQRAVEECQHLARSNRGLWAFEVIERSTGVVLAHFTGTLPELYPDGRSRYGNL